MAAYTLINGTQCYFDHAEFETEAEAIEWAEGRNGTYALVALTDSPDGEELVARWVDGRRVE